MNSYTVGVVGNPNCGKTTLFNVLTGAKQHVGNWPGVTVDRKEGYYHYHDHDVTLVDLPGIYSLDIVSDSSSLDEHIAQNYILSDQADLFINIIDGSNIERNLYLTTQLLEMQVPFIIVINMMDVATQQGIQIDVETLSSTLGVPVIPVSASHHQGIEKLKEAIDYAVKMQIIPNRPFSHVDMIEQAITQLEPQVAPYLKVKQHIRWISLKLLEEDTTVVPEAKNTLKNTAKQLQLHIENKLQEDIDILVADGRYNYITRLVEAVVKRSHKISRTTSDKIDNVVLNRFLGIPIFLAIMYLMFMFTINLGSAFIDFFDILVGTVLVDGVAEFLTYLQWPEWLVVLLASGVGGGIQVVATFIPIVGFLFLFLSFLEDSGYMARAAFVMDRFMRFIGLPGKSFVPLIVGFGCNVPGIMATRTLENQRDRFLTVTMTPFMSCGARLPVYALFAAAFFPVGGQNLVFSLYLIGIAVAVLTGLIMKYTLLQGQSAPFVMELPNYHLPTMQSILLRTWDRLKNFIFRAGQVIVPMVVVLSFLNAWGTDGSFGEDNYESSMLSEIGRTLTPAFEPMGIHEDNWPATVGIFTGVLAKEAVVGTLDSIYSQLATSDIPTEDTEFSLMAGIQEAFASVPENLMAMSNLLLDPLGLQIGDMSDINTAAEEQEVALGTYGAMVARFDGQVGAFAYLLFILLYFPCAAATAAIYRETHFKWTLFVVSWTTGMAYLLATVFYQTMTFSQHPTNSGLWIAGLVTAFLLAVMVLYISGRKNNMAISHQPLFEKT